MFDLFINYNGNCFTLNETIVQYSDISNVYSIGPCSVIRKK